MFSPRCFALSLRRQKALEEEERERKKEERLRKREQKLREREERKNLKKLRRQQEEEQKKLQMKIAMEERRLLLAQRNLESIRLIAELLARAKVGQSWAAGQVTSHLSSHWSKTFTPTEVGVWRWEHMILIAGHDEPKCNLYWCVSKQI